jgi:hypothetical protein
MKTFAIPPNSETASYDYLAQLPRDRWAWEFARRNEGLRADAAHRRASDVSEKRAPCADIRILRSRVPQKLAERWGLVFMPDPECGTRARPTRSGAITCSRTRSR